MIAELSTEDVNDRYVGGRVGLTDDNSVWYGFWVAHWKGGACRCRGVIHRRDVGAAGAGGYMGLGGAPCGKSPVIGMERR